MIPDFDRRGYLPAGLHGATLDEIGQKTELRQVQMESLRWLVEQARRARIARIVVNGSFVTDVPEPNDVDCVLLAAADLKPDDPALTQLFADLPFLSSQVVDQGDLISLWIGFSPRIRDMSPKGMIDVLP
jgi:hypothetical protein